MVNNDRYVNWKIKAVFDYLDASIIRFIDPPKQRRCNCQVGWLGDSLWGFHDCQNRESLLDKLEEKEEENG